MLVSAVRGAYFRLTIPTQQSPNPHSHSEKPPKLQCRERGVSYKGKIQVKLLYQLDGEEVREDIRPLGDLPIMVKSDRCNLRNKTPQQLIRLHEEVCFSMTSDMM